MGYDHYDLFAHVDSHLTRPKIKTNREKRFYPSEASVVYTDSFGDKVTQGTCLRASYFRLAEEFVGEPYDARTQFIFEMGNRVEAMLISKWKEMGVWIDNNVKFIDKKHNISGEIDAVLAEPPNGQLYGVEVKSFYGYYSESELFGNRKKKGFPKINQLLQTLIYTDNFKNLLPYFRMVYFARDSVKRKTFLVELEGNQPKVDGEPVTEFTMDDIYARYSKLQSCLDAGVIPPGDYELQYPREKIIDFYSKGKIGKTKYEKWQRGKLKKHENIGDWQCSYCRFSEVCYGSNKDL